MDMREIRIKGRALLKRNWIEIVFTININVGGYSKYTVKPGVIKKIS
jgi:hypothetical protein